MNLQQTVSKILGYEVTKEGAMEFADKQFGTLSAYLRENPYLPKNKYSEVTQELKVLQISEDAIIDGVVKLLHGSEAFTDATDTNEVLYQGDIFDSLIKGNYHEAKILIQLKELAELSKKYDYIQVINRK